MSKLYKRIILELRQREQAHPQVEAERQENSSSKEDFMKHALAHYLCGGLCLEWGSVLRGERGRFPLPWPLPHLHLVRWSQTGTERRRLETGTQQYSAKGIASTGEEEELKHWKILAKSVI